MGCLIKTKEIREIYLHIKSSAFAAFPMSFRILILNKFNLSKLDHDFYKEEKGR